MNLIKTPEEIEILRQGGKRLAGVLLSLAEAVRPGISTKELDSLAFSIIDKAGDRPSFLGCKPSGAKKPYPASICASVNDEVVHGEPNENPRILKDGDIIGLDVGLIHRGLFTDAAITVGVGKISAKAGKLLETTKIALRKGIEAARAGGTTGDIGFAIESFVKPLGYGIVRELAGHGVGRAMHEEPLIPNFGRRGQGTELKAGMVIAIEPMLNEGGREIFLAEDGHTFKTKDGSLSAHFEKTVLITGKGNEILT